MKIYHYHPETFAYVGESMVDPDPLEPWKWLIPACAVEIAPPAPVAGRYAAWNGAGWDLLDIPPPPDLPVV